MATRKLKIVAHVVFLLNSISLDSVHDQGRKGKKWKGKAFINHVNPSYAAFSLDSN